MFAAAMHTHFTSSLAGPAAFAACSRAFSSAAFDVVPDSTAFGSGTDLGTSSGLTSSLAGAGFAAESVFAARSEAFTTTRPEWKSAGSTQTTDLVRGSRLVTVMVRRYLPVNVVLQVRC